jgi:tetratricopeptide (TPR) repeat protein
MESKFRTGVNARIEMEMSTFRNIKLLRLCLAILCLPGAAAGQPAPDAMTTLDSADTAANISRYEALISDLESRYGAYHVDLSETLVGLGRAYQEKGDYAAAVSALQRSLHINRVNNGLYDSGQLPILSLLIEANKARRDWQALDQNYHYRYWITRRAYGEKDPRQLPALYDAAHWHLDAYYGGVDEYPLPHLLKAYDLYTRAVRILEANGGPDNPDLVTPLYATARTLYEMRQLAANFFAGEKTGISEDNRTGFNERTTDSENQLYAIVGNTFREGKQALERAIAIYRNHPELPAEERAAALVHLGDWHLLYDKTGKALDNYHEVYSIAGSEEGLLKKIDGLFSEPRSIPVLRLPDNGQPQQSPADKDANVNYVIASFNVSETGRPFNIHILEAKPANDASMRRQARQDIRGTRFRPRFEKGQPVASTNVNFRYVFPGTLQ